MEWRSHTTSPVFDQYKSPPPTVIDSKSYRARPDRRIDRGAQFVGVIRLLNDAVNAEQLGIIKDRVPFKPDDYDHGHARCKRIAAQFPKDGPTVDHRHREVEDNRRRSLRAGETITFQAVAGADDSEARSELIANQLALIGIIFNQQDTMANVSSAHTYCGRTAGFGR